MVSFVVHINLFFCSFLPFFLLLLPQSLHVSFSSFLCAIPYDLLICAYTSKSINQRFQWIIYKMKRIIARFSCTHIRWWCSAVNKAHCVDVLASINLECVCLWVRISIYVCIRGDKRSRHYGKRFICIGNSEQQQQQKHSIVTNNFQWKYKKVVNESEWKNCMVKHDRLSTPLHGWLSVSRVVAFSSQHLLLSVLLLLLLFFLSAYPRGGGKASDSVHKWNWQTFWVEINAFWVRCTCWRTLDLIAPFQIK